MPKIVDHDARRKEIGSLVLNVIGLYGLPGATIRTISREGGFSSGVLSHYFTNKKEMLDLAFGVVAEQTFIRIQSRIERENVDALSKIKIVIEELLPLDPSDPESVVPVHFWAAVLQDSSLAGHLRDRYAIWHSTLTSFIEEAISDDLIDSNAKVREEVDMLIALTDGLLVSWTVNPESVNEAYKKHLINKMFADFTHRVAKQ